MLGAQQNGGQGAPHPHPRTLGWVGATALALAGSNSSLFILGPLVAGQGSAAIPLLVVGVLLAFAASFGWTELVLMWPNRVGGIAATCAEAFRPYNPMLAGLAGVCYWWGWAPAGGLTVAVSAAAITQWYLPGVPLPVVAAALLVLFTAANLCGIRWTSRLAVACASVSAGLALLSGLIPVVTGHVDWKQATTFHLVLPFPGPFGGVTAVMAGLYLVAYAAPAFEAATCHVGEMVDPARNVPRAMVASGLLSVMYGVLLPVVWLGVLGSDALQGDLAVALGPTFAPLLGDVARAAAIWLMVFNGLHCVIQPLAGASRTLMQLAEDGLVPRLFGLRSRLDVPWVSTLVTAAAAVALLLWGGPLWLVAATNLAYLVSLALPSVAVWLLRRDAPDLPRPYRAPRGTIVLGIGAAAGWNAIAVLGFQQFGLPSVLVGLALCLSGAALYVVRVCGDRRRAGLSTFSGSMQVQLTGAMLAVLALDAAIGLLAVRNVGQEQTMLLAALEDMFVEVGILTLAVALVLPGIIAFATGQVADAAKRLANGTLADVEAALEALSRGRLDPVPIRVDDRPLSAHVGEELGAMTASFNTMQGEIARIAVALDGARENLRRADDVVRASEERFRSLVQSVTDVICVIGDGGRVRYVSPAIETILGVSPDEVIGRASLGLTHPDDVPGVIRLLDDLRARPGGRRTCELRMRHRDGSLRLVDVVVTNLLHVRGVEGMVLTAHDITDRHAAAEALARQYQEAETARGEARATLDAAGDAMMVVSPEGQVLALNRSFEEIFLLRERDLRGEPFDRVRAQLAPRFADPAAFPAAVRAAARGDDGALHLAQRWPTPRDLALSSSPVRKPSGEPIGRLYSFRDVTRERAVDRMKSEFVALVSHELRTPLTSIKGYVELLLAGEVGDLDEEQARFLEVVQRNANRLMGLISALLDLSRLEAGKIELQRQPLDVGQIARQILESFAPQLASHRQTARLQLDPLVPPVYGDPERVAQVLTNLVSNAQKYTPDGGTITVAASSMGASVRIDVRDTGVGMTAEEQAQLFTRFYRAQNRATQQVSGTGLGLAITKSLVELHGGTIAVESARGAGSTFTVLLPALESASAPGGDVASHVRAGALAAG